MRAVTFQAPGEVRVDEVAEPVLTSPDEAIIEIEASGVCGSDLHIYHGRVPVDPGTTIGHEYVGTVTAVGDAVTRVAVGDRVLGCFLVACGTCANCLRGDYHRCERGRTFGHGKNLGALGGTQADQALVPFADIVLRKVPEGMSADVGALRRRRDGDRLPRGRPRRDAGGRHGRGARARPGRALRGAGGGGRPARPRSSRSIRSSSGSSWRRSSAPPRSTSPRATRKRRCGRRPKAAAPMS